MSIQGFDDWLETPQGRYVLQWEQAKYDLLVADIFGFNALQLGLPQHDFLRANRMQFRFRCDDKPLANIGGKFARADVCAGPHQLPFANSSLDLVVLPHVLEFAESPHQILREVERVLVPDGHVVVTGFNPFSLWGIRRKFARHDDPPPWRGQYLSVLRLKDWFALLALESQAGSFGCYAPAVTQEQWLQRWRFMELAGNRWWPIAGAVYIIQAVKRVCGMRLITPVWAGRKAHAKSLAPIAQRKVRHETNDPCDQ